MSQEEPFKGSSSTYPAWCAAAWNAPQTPPALGDRCRCRDAGRRQPPPPWWQDDVPLSVHGDLQGGKIRIRGPKGGGGVEGVGDGITYPPCGHLTCPDGGGSSCDSCCDRNRAGVDVWALVVTPKWAPMWSSSPSDPACPAGPSNGASVKGGKSWLIKKTDQNLF